MTQNKVKASVRFVELGSDMFQADEESEKKVSLKDRD